MLRRKLILYFIDESQTFAIDLLEDVDFDPRDPSLNAFNAVPIRPKNCFVENRNKKFN